MGANILGPLVKAAIDAYIAGLAGPADIDRDDLFEVMWDEVEDWVGEYGTNADGSYLIINIGGVRVQVCWASDIDVTTSSISNQNIGTYGWSFYLGSTAVTFAREFASKPAIAVSGDEATANGHLSYRTDTVSTTGFRVVGVSYVNATYSCGYVAIGLAS